MSYYTAEALCKVTRSPRTVKVVESHKSILHVGSRTHLRGTAHKDTHLTGANLGEQFLFTGIGIGIVYKGDFFLRDATLHKFLLQILIDVKTAVAFRGGKVAEHKLRCPFLFALIPYTEYVTGAGGNLAVFIVGCKRIEKPHIKC